MIQSLVDASAQEGWLPCWPLVNGPTSVMGGDSVDPVIAGAFAFGARDFNARAALAAAVKGATTIEPPLAQGWYVERWELRDEYLSRRYVVNTHTTSVSPVPNGASETLEYALDDFAIARLAYELRDMRAYDTFLRRSSNWTTLFDGAIGEIAPRDADGAFMQTPLTENGQSGFQEGNAAQYTWMVPQDLRDLIAAMGGPRAAVTKLDAFFAQLDAGQDKPYAWLGNEPSLGTPWVYLSAGEPWRAQEIVRQALTSLYSDTPAGLPGNDDLGTMSAWYLWCAMGLYPQNPAVRYLDVGAPLFSSIRIQSPGGPVIEISAPQNDDGDPYVQQLHVDGRESNQSWVSLPYAGTLRLDFRLGALPNARWGSLRNDAPPSYAAGHLTLPPSFRRHPRGAAGGDYGPGWRLRTARLSDIESWRRRAGGRNVAGGSPRWASPARTPGQRVATAGQHALDHLATVGRCHRERRVLWRSNRGGIRRRRAATTSRPYRAYHAWRGTDSAGLRREPLR
jgi:predicted alpha-1,2-mannosidase